MIKQFKKAVYVGLAAQVKLQARIDRLAAEGESSQNDCARRVQDVLRRFEKGAQKWGQDRRHLIDKVLHAVQVPTRSDIDRLEQRLADLAARLERSARP